MNVHRYSWFSLLLFLFVVNLSSANVANAQICEPPFCDPDVKSKFGERFALVIGNSNYQGDAHLDNPQNDAADIGAKLQEMGFKVETLIDGDYIAMKAAINRFSAQLISGSRSVGLFFFAGHGMQQSDQNYLIPVDTVEAIQNSGEVNDNAVSLNDVVDTMNRAEVSIIILDACRNNPMGEVVTGSGRTLSRVGASASSAMASGNSEQKVMSRQPMGGGLAQPPKASNRALFAYATSPGDTAADGTGRNSPFTSGLLTSIRKEHRLEDVFAETQESVLKKTSKKQKPWTTQSLGDIKFYF